MASTNRQTAIFGIQDWKTLYQTYQEADFQSYDFETLRKSFIDYLRLYYPETYNDYIESSELIALLDVIAFMGQSLAFRTDLNTRENFLDTAERRDSVIKLANLVGYTPKRNTEANGYLKVTSVQTTENVVDYNGVNLANITVNWADPSNFDWQEQFIAILNAALVSTQRFGQPGAATNILGVQTDEYTLNLVPGFIPVVPYTSTVDGVNMPFEAVNATASGQIFVYEPAPLPNGRFNTLFRNDSQGFSSDNTGFFFYFKQGILQNQDFNLTEAITNRQVNININGINNTDIWLYQLDDTGAVAKQWTQVESVYSPVNENLNPTAQTIFSVSSRNNDQITLNFGDGVFGTVPVGQFRCYVRASNGLQYIINPDEMQNISIPISYTSRTGSIETITFTCGITQPVTNSQARETLAQIKQRAPARYYTQNRMVNGEDYNNFPFTQYNSILKSNAVNRASIGTSRYLDLVDPTGKYSSTNIFADDGALWEEDNLPTFTFTWFTTNDINDVIINRIQPALTNIGMTQFYYQNYPRIPLTSLNMSWNESTFLVGECTGYFKDTNGFPIPLGSYTSTNAKYIQVASLIEFTAPAGYYFDNENQLQSGVPSTSGGSTSIWASPSAIYQDGTNQGDGNFADGTGPVVLNTFVPTGAIASQVIALFKTDFTSTLVTQIVQQVQVQRDFGLRYDNFTGTWYIITSANLAVNAPFSLQYAGSEGAGPIDASWLVQATTDGYQYTVQFRNLDYYFGSVIETRFFYYGAEQIYDSRTGTVVKDFIKVLKSNSQPDSNAPMTQDFRLNIIGQPTEADGYVNDYQVVVSIPDVNADGIPDDPDAFAQIVAPNTNSNKKLVFFQQTIDFDNLERYLLLKNGVVNSNYPTQQAIGLVEHQFVVGQVFYAYSTGDFFQLVANSDGSVKLVAATGYLARTGRQDLYFEYRHNSPLTSIIDPGSSNIIDLYVVTLEYYTAYTNWIRDTTGTVVQPIPPTLDQLTTQYAALQNYKMISDNMILNCVQFVPLFGSKAPKSLQATIKVIPASNTTASNTEIKNLVVTVMNEYFSIDVWNFGDTFYFSELGAYIHGRIGNIVSSVVLVPLDPNAPFGDLYEVQAQPNQIFVNGATINNIEVITALTSSTLQAGVGGTII